MEQIFYLTGVVVWFFIGTLVAGFLLLAFCHWYDREVLPSLGNLRFAIFGKPWNERATYYNIWAGKAKWKYRYYTRGRGNRHFARLAMKRLVYEARKESRKKAAETGR